MNIKLDDKILSICKSHFEVVNYDRSKEPIDIKEKRERAFFGGLKKLVQK